MSADYDSQERRRFARRVPKSAAYRAVEAEAARLGWPERYTTDLSVEDRLLLAHEPARFGWLAHPSGTYTITNRTPGIAQYYARQVREFGHPAQFFAYQRGDWRACPPEVFLAFCASLPAFYRLVKEPWDPWYGSGSDVLVEAEGRTPAERARFTLAPGPAARLMKLEAAASSAAEARRDARLLMQLQDELRAAITPQVLTLEPGHFLHPGHERFQFEEAHAAD